MNNTQKIMIAAVLSSLAGCVGNDQYEKKETVEVSDFSKASREDTLIGPVPDPRKDILDVQKAMSNYRAFNYCNPMRLQRDLANKNRYYQAPKNYHTQNR